MAGNSPEYQYTLKDHLGNTRITFTTRSLEVDSFVAYMDTGGQVEEENIFGAYNSFTNQALDPTPSANVDDKILILNGGHNGQVGLTKSFAVAPGDQITMSVYAKFLESTGDPSSLANFATALTEAFGLSPNSPGEAARAFQALNSFGNLIAGGDRVDDDNEPKGFLNIIAFDQNYNFMDGAFRQITAADQTNDTISLRLKIREIGYVYAFLSNESTTLQQIGFDTYVVSQHHNNIIQMDDYYPFGLTFNSYQRENSVSQRYLYNGKELQDELALSWFDYGAAVHVRHRRGGR